MKHIGEQDLKTFRTYPWPIDRRIVPEFVPAVLRALFKSLVDVAPIVNARDYYRSLVQALLSPVVQGRLTLPNELTEGEVIVRYGDLLYAVNRNVVFGYYMLPFEPVTYRTLSKQTGGTFLDLGANVGQYSIPLAKRFERVIAVEPNPLALKVLHRNVQLNGLRNVTIVAKAVSPYHGSVQLHEGRFLTTWSTVPSSLPSVSVEAITLDELLEESGPLDLLKIDVEDAELEILRSLKGSLEKVSQVVIETQRAEVLEILLKLGFKLEVLGGWIHRWETVRGTRARSHGYAQTTG
jgi:FkbM family methyltransferase